MPEDQDATSTIELVDNDNGGDWSLLQEPSVTEPVPEPPADGEDVQDAGVEKEESAESPQLEEAESPAEQPSVDVTIPTFSPELLARAAMNGIPLDLAKSFKSPESLQALIDEHANRGRTDTQEKPPPETPSAEPLVSFEPFAFTPEEESNFDDDTKATLARMSKHHEEQMRKAVETLQSKIAPAEKAVAQAEMERKQQVVSFFDQTVNGLTAFHGVAGNVRPQEGSPAYMVRGAAFEMAEHLEDVARSMGQPVDRAEIIRRAMSAVTGIPYTPEKPSGPSKEEDIAARSAARRGQAIGKPAASGAEPIIPSPKTLQTPHSVEMFNAAELEAGGMG